MLRTVLKSSGVGCLVMPMLLLAAVLFVVMVPTFGYLYSYDEHNNHQLLKCQGRSGQDHDGFIHAVHMGGLGPQKVKAPLLGTAVRERRLLLVSSDGTDG